MSSARIDLSKYRHVYRSEKSAFIRGLWFFVGLPLLRCQILPGSAFRSRLLRLFGAEIGRGVVIKPGVRVKYPWLLGVGDHTWIGEDCWIDNLAPVRLGSSVCVSQGSYFCTGNHDWSDTAFALVVRPIRVHDGAWICARATVLPGVTIGEGAVLAAASVASKSIPPYTVHAGNPASFAGLRQLKDISGAYTCASF